MKKLFLLTICFSLLFFTVVSVSAEKNNDLKLRRFDQIPNHPPQVVFPGTPPVMGHRKILPPPQVVFPCKQPVMGHKKILSPPHSSYHEFCPPAPPERLKKNLKAIKRKKIAAKKRKLKKIRKRKKARVAKRKKMRKNSVEDKYFLKTFSMLEKLLFKMNKKAKKPAMKRQIVNKVSNLLKSSMLYREGKTKEALKFINPENDPKNIRKKSAAKRRRKLDEKINSYKKKVMAIKKKIQAMKMEFKFYENELLELEDARMRIREKQIDNQFSKLENRRTEILIKHRGIELELEYIKGELERTRDSEKRASLRKKIFKLRKDRMNYEERLRLVTVQLEEREYAEKENEEEVLYRERNMLHETILEIKDNMDHSNRVSERKIKSIQNKIKDLDYMIDRLRK